MHPIFQVSLLQPYSAGGTTLGPLDPIVFVGAEEEYEVESMLRYWQQGRLTRVLGALAWL